VRHVDAVLAGEPAFTGQAANTDGSPRSVAVGCPYDKIFYARDLRDRDHQ
jgi:hypothetical protein